MSEFGSSRQTLTYLGCPLPSSSAQNFAGSPSWMDVGATMGTFLVPGLTPSLAVSGRAALHTHARVSLPSPGVAPKRPSRGFGKALGLTRALGFSRARRGMCLTLLGEGQRVQSTC